MKTLPPILLLALLAVPATVHADEPARLIFDTDMMGDVDDVGTVAVLHALANQGELEILAMALSANPTPWRSGCWRGSRRSADGRASLVRRARRKCRAI